MSTDPENGKLMARAGEHLCCANGHQNYRFTADIRAGELAATASVEPVNGMPDPTPYEDMAVCCICDALQVRFGPTRRRQINVDGEWRGDGLFLAEAVN